MPQDVFVVLDAVRYDCFSGMDFENLPNDPLKAYSPACWTGGSFFTYFCGLSPIKAKEFVFDPGINDRPGWMPREIRRTGTHTQLYTGSAWLKLHGEVFSRGFDDPVMSLGQNQFDDFVEQWDPPEENFFTVFHVLETHNPIFDGQRNHQLIKDRDRNWDLMEKSLSYVDGVFGDLVGKMPEGSRVTVTADHGEAFGEGGSWGHSPRAPPAKEQIVGGPYRLEGSPDSAFEIPYAVGDKTDGRIEWRDSSEVAL